MELKMHKSPIFHMLELVDRGSASDIELSFKDSLVLKCTAEKSKEYYLLKLTIQRADYLFINSVYF